MRFRVLGHLLVEDDDGQPVAGLAPRQRQLLARLVASLLDIVDTDIGRADSTRLAALGQAARRDRIDALLEDRRPEAALDALGPLRRHRSSLTHEPEPFG